MALFDNGLRTGTAIAIGVGALVLAPVVLPVIAAAFKPLARAGIKSGLVLLEKGRELVAETSEIIEDLAAEARSELAAERSARAQGPEVSPAVEQTG